jgi:hypothetical protein
MRGASFRPDFGCSRSIISALSLTELVYFFFL